MLFYIFIISKASEMTKIFFPRQLFIENEIVTESEELCKNKSDEKIMKSINHVTSLNVEQGAMTNKDAKEAMATFKNNDVRCLVSFQKKISLKFFPIFFFIFFFPIFFFGFTPNLKFFYVFCFYQTKSILLLFFFLGWYNKQFNF